MTVRRQLFLAVGLLVLVVTGLGAWLVLANARLANLAMQTEVASRQATLAQRLTSKALLFRASRLSEPAVELRRTVEQFQQSLSALTGGGRVPVDAAGREFRYVEGVQDEEVSMIARRQQVLWQKTAKAVQTFLDSGGSDLAALQILTDNDTDLVTSTNEMTGRLVVMAADGVDRTRLLQLVSVFAALVAGAIVFLVGHRVSRAIAVLTASADAMSRGDLETPVPTDGAGETAELGRSLERMRISLKKAMELLGRRS
jgi:HAMP domain-containing protein